MIGSGRHLGSHLRNTVGGLCGIVVADTVRAANRAVSRWTEKIADVT